MRSLPPTLEHVSFFLDITGRGDYLSADFLETVRKKIGLIIESVEANRGSVIVWSDIDIIFVRDFTATVQSIFDEDPQLDIAFQKEDIDGDDVNTGFIALRCNDRVKAFFENVSRSMAVHRDWNEQKTINQLILNNDQLAWTYLPLSFYARTHGWPPPIDSVLYHANGTIGADGVGQKERQFKKFANYVRRPDVVLRSLLARAGDAWRRRADGGLT